MLRHFFIITFRNMRRNLLQTLIEIGGLAVGMAVFILIIMWVKDQVSYDKFNEKYDRIYRMGWRNNLGLQGAQTMTGVAPYIKEHLPEVEYVARMLDWNSNTLRISGLPEDMSIFRIQKGYFADSSVFNVFSFRFVMGDPGHALNRSKTIVLTESLAKRLFGNNDPLGKRVINSYQGHEVEYTITGVIADVYDFSLPFGALASFTTLGDLFGNDFLSSFYGGKANYSITTFFTLSRPQPVEAIEKRMNEVCHEVLEPNPFNWKLEVVIQPLSSIYFHGTERNTDETSTYVHGRLAMVYSLSATAFLVLFLSMVNFILLGIARTASRLKEITLKKIAGSGLILIRLQFIFEAGCMTLLSFVASLTLVQLFLPSFNKLMQSRLLLDLQGVGRIGVIIILAFLLLGLGVGLYASFYFSGQSLAGALKRGFMQGNKPRQRRQLLVIVQFAITIALLVSTLVVFVQLRFMKNANLGFNKESIIHFPYSGPRHQLHDELEKLGAVKHVAFTNVSLGDHPRYATIRPLGADTPTIIQYYSVDDEFQTLFEIPILEGNNIPTNTGNPLEVILNESAARFLNMAVGARVLVNTDPAKIPGKIVGIIKDANFRSLHYPVEPIYFCCIAGDLGTANVKIENTNLPGTLKSIEKIVRKLEPGNAFDYSFLDQSFNQQYKSDEQVFRATIYLVGLALIIACLGLFGISSFSVIRRTKEIGIRKANGAHVFAIYLMFAKDFLAWVLLSIVFAVPLAWYAMDRWMQQFAYKAHIGAWPYVLASIIALVIALLTITGQSLWVAKSNPVEALRYE